MFTGIYVERISPFHRLDPRVKLVWVLLVLVASAASQFSGLKGLPVFASMLVALTLSRVGAKFAAFLIFNMLVFLAVTTLVWAGLYSAEGNLMLSLSFIRITDVGVNVALGKFFLIVNPVLAFTVFFATTRPYHIMWTLDKLRFPHKLSLTFTMALSLLPLVVQSVREVIEVQTARGLALDRGGLLERLKKHTPVIIPVISKLLSDVWDLSIVLASRFAGYGRRTYVEELKWSKRDTLFAVASLLFYGGVVLWTRLP